MIFHCRFGGIGPPALSLALSAVRISCVIIQRSCTVDTEFGDYLSAIPGVPIGRAYFDAQSPYLFLYLLHVLCTVFYYNFILICFSLIPAHCWNTVRNQARLQGELNKYYLLNVKCVYISYYNYCKIQKVNRRRGKNINITVSLSIVQLILCDSFCALRFRFFVQIDVFILYVAAFEMWNLRSWFVLGKRETLHLCAVPFIRNHVQLYCVYLFLRRSDK